MSDIKPDVPSNKKARTAGHTAAIVAVGVLTVAFNPLWCAIAVPYVAWGLLRRKKGAHSSRTDPASGQPAPDGLKRP